MILENKSGIKDDIKKKTIKSKKYDFKPLNAAADSDVQSINARPTALTSVDGIIDIFEEEKGSSRCIDCICKRNASTY